MPKADTTSQSRHDFAFSRRDLPEACYRISLPSKSRAQGKPGARCTRGLVCKMHKKMRTRAYRFSGGIRPSLRNGFTAYFVLSPATNASCPRRLRIKPCLSPVGPTHLRKLDISNGCQDHTTSPYALAPFV